MAKNTSIYGRYSTGEKKDSCFPASSLIKIFQDV